MSENNCYDCNNRETKKKSKSLEKIIEKAKSWATTNEYKGELVIIRAGNSYGFRKPDCPCLGELTEIDRIYID